MDGLSRMRWQRRKVVPGREIAEASFRERETRGGTLLIHRVEGLDGISCILQSAIKTHRRRRRRGIPLLDCLVVSRLGFVVNVFR